MKNAILYTVIAAFIAVVGVVTTQVIMAVRQAGHDAAIAEMEKTNEQSKRNAEAAEDAVLACTRAGGQWMRREGICSRH
jgi:hypothetical protein